MKILTPGLKKLKQFSVNNASTHLWLLKDSDSSVKFRAWYLNTSLSIEDSLKVFVKDQLKNITDSRNYSHISQNDETSCLTLPSSNTDFEFLKKLVDRPEPDHTIKENKTLIGTKGYVAKFTHGEKILYAVRRTPSSWKTTYKKNFINVIFENGELSAAEDNNFSIERSFDFYVLDGNIFVTNKSGFESILKYKSGYMDAFSLLQEEPVFTKLFLDIAPLKHYVGENTNYLRRMSVVGEKAIYDAPNFIPILKRVNSNRKWGLTFSGDQILLSSANVKEVITILLDHRLISEITQNMYDVQDANEIL